MAVWAGMGQAATVAQMIGVDTGGLISMILQAADTARENRKKCEQLARRVSEIARLLTPLEQDPDVMRWKQAELDGTLREAHALVLSCQGRCPAYRFFMAGRQAERFRDVQSRIDSNLSVFPLTSHIAITRRLDRIYHVQLSNHAFQDGVEEAFTFPEISCLRPTTTWPSSRSPPPPRAHPPSAPHPADQTRTDPARPRRQPRPTEPPHRTAAKAATQAQVRHLPERSRHPSAALPDGHAARHAGSGMPHLTAARPRSTATLSHGAAAAPSERSRQPRDPASKEQRRRTTPPEGPHRRVATARGGETKKGNTWHLR